MIVSIAWKNVWRNKYRSLVVIAAITIGVFAGVFAIALMNSSVVQRLDAAVNEELSHVQVNTRNFRRGGEINSVIPAYDSLVSQIRKIPGVSETTGRLIIRGIASTAAKSLGVEITGINVDREKTMFTLPGKLIAGTGSFFETRSKLNNVVIGEKLAKELGIIRYILDDKSFASLEEQNVTQNTISKLRQLAGQRFTSDKKFNKAVAALLTKKEEEKFSWLITRAAWSYREGAKIILTFLDVNNIQTGAAFRVSGIFRTNNDQFEASSVFVPDDELRTLTGMAPETWHRIMVRITDNSLTAEVTERIRDLCPGLEVLAWKEIQPELAMLADFMQQIYGIFMAIILAALAFGIVNTMLMSVLERTRELGMLAAIGMNHRRIFSMIMLESVFLSVVGGFAGMAVGGAAIALTARNGINLVRYSEGLEAFGYSAHLYPTIDTTFFIMTTLLIVLTGVLSSVYPARKALKMNPVEALRKE